MQPAIDFIWNETRGFNQFPVERLMPITHVLERRRATQHFDSKEIPLGMLSAVLYAGRLAPSGYNLQPWRFIVVQDPLNKQRLQTASMNQSKISEAPIVIIAVGMKRECLSQMHEIFLEGVKNGVGDEDQIKDQEIQALRFLNSIPMAVWVNRHVMIAVTSMMLAAESFGIDTAPMEGFDADRIKREFDIPDEGEVVCLLALGYGKKPDKVFPGRLAFEQTCFFERFGQRA